MCGLFGAFGPGTAAISPQRCAFAIDTIAHRGPDANGIWRDANIILGHTRLSILDLDPRAGQPMRRGSLAFVFNGEIYNFRALRGELEQAGEGFKTTSDTEVLLAGLDRHGINFLERVEGMFAFGLWDGRDGSLTLARDRFGEKPLFLSVTPSLALFASEIAAIEALAPRPMEEDAGAIGLYVRFSYVPAPLAPIAGIEQLEPGTWRRLGSGGAQAAGCYYSAPKPVASSLSYPEAVAQTRTRLTECVSQRLSTADVPVATLLSGGLDSSIVTGIAAKTYDRPVRAYSLSFPDDAQFDEAVYAHAVTARLSNVEHCVVEARIGDLLRFVDAALDRLSEPFADASLIPTAYLMSHIEEKVVLGGDGADEVFAGYGTYPAMLMSARLPRGLKAALRAIPAVRNPAAVRNPLLRSAALFHANLREDPVAEYLSWRTYASVDTLQRLGLDAISEHRIIGHLSTAATGRLRDVQEVDIAFNLPNDMLRKVDIASMMFSKEVRLPYLDSSLVKYALDLPDSYRLKGRTRKRVLRDAFAADLPPEILSRRKMGFLMPIRSWFRSGLLRDRFEALAASQTRFEGKELRGLLGEHETGKHDHSVLLWSLLVYLRWREVRQARRQLAA